MLTLGEVICQEIVVKSDSIEILVDESLEFRLPLIAEPAEESYSPEVIVLTPPNLESRIPNPPGFELVNLDEFLTSIYLEENCFEGSHLRYMIRFRKDGTYLKHKLISGENKGLEKRIGSLVSFLRSTPYVRRQKRTVIMTIPSCKPSR